MSGEQASSRPVVDGATAERLISVPLALGTATVLGIALWLEPSAIGHGTHTQLGLGSCSFLTWCGYPCPMCGATTSFALMAHLHPIQALLNQPFASLLFLMTLGTLGVSTAEVVQPRRRWSRILDAIEPVETWLALAFLALMGASWAWKVALMEGWISWV